MDVDRVIQWLDVKDGGLMRVFILSGYPRFSEPAMRHLSHWPFFCVGPGQNRPFCLF